VICVTDDEPTKAVGGGVPAPTVGVVGGGVGVAAVSPARPPGSAGVSTPLSYNFPGSSPAAAAAAAPPMGATAAGGAPAPGTIVRYFKVPLAQMPDLGPNRQVPVLIERCIQFIRTSGTLQNPPLTTAHRFLSSHSTSLPPIDCHC
jgi:hypothetical protein